MLVGIKRFFTRAMPGRRGSAVAEWAASQGFSHRPVRQGHDGFVVDGRLGAQPWRLEWGPSQRSYIQGPELRIRAELGLPADLQVLVLDHPLQATMEKAVFEQYVDGVQTRIDDQTPPEMRWLVMYTKLTGAELGALRERFAAVSPAKKWLTQWLHGPLTPLLLAAPLLSGQPMVLMVSRGRLALRTALGDPQPVVLDAWLRLFHQAMCQACEVSGLLPEAGLPNTQPTASGAKPAPRDNAPR